MNTLAMTLATHLGCLTWGLTLAIAFASCQAANAELARPNIVLIMADDLGYSDLGCYGSEIATPHLDRLARGGVRLTQFYTTGRCCPSRASLLTGFYPHRVGLGHMTQDLGQPGYRGRVADEAQTLAQMLKPLGYRSFLAGKWHLGTDDPTQHGFEEFYGTLVSAKTFWEADHFTRLPEDRQPRRYPAKQFYGTDALTDHALDFLSQARETAEQPWFLYLAYNAPHFPLHAPPETIAKYVGKYDQGWDVLRDQRLARMKQIGIVPEQTELTPRSEYYDWGQFDGEPNPPWDSLNTSRRADLARRMAIYAAMIDRMDQNIGRVLNDLKERGELDNTLIIFTSDNGACAEWDPFGFDIQSGPGNILHRGEMLEQMGSEDTYHSVGSGWANASNTPWRLYKHFNHEGGIAVPCIFHWPARLEREVEGSVNGTPTHLIDVAPTLLEAASGKSPPTSPSKHQSVLPGQNLLPLLEGQRIADRMLFFEHEGNRAVRAGHWKVVALRSRAWELYDMRSDRSELTSLASQYPEVVRQLSGAWDAWAKENHVTPLPTDYKVEYIKPLRSQ